MTFCADRKSPKNRQRGEGFRFPSPLKKPLTLKRPKGKGVRALPFGNPHPGIGDYQIAPLPQSGKGRWRPLAAIGEKGSTSKNRLSVFENTLRGGIFAISPNFAAKICHTSRNVKNFPVRACNSGNAVLYSKHKCRLAQNPYRGFPFFESKE